MYPECDTAEPALACCFDVCLVIFTSFLDAPTVLCRPGLDEETPVIFLGFHPGDPPEEGCAAVGHYYYYEPHVKIYLQSWLLGNSGAGPRKRKQKAEGQATPPMATKKRSASSSTSRKSSTSNEDLTESGADKSAGLHSIPSSYTPRPLAPRTDATSQAHSAAGGTGASTLAPPMPGRSLAASTTSVPPGTTIGDVDVASLSPVSNAPPSGEGQDIRALALCPDFIAQFDPTSSQQVPTPYAWNDAETLVQDLRAWAKPHDFSFNIHIRSARKSVSS